MLHSFNRIDSRKPPSTPGLAAEGRGLQRRHHAPPLLHALRLWQALTLASFPICPHHALLYVAGRSGAEPDAVFAALLDRYGLAAETVTMEL